MNTEKSNQTKVLVLTLCFLVILGVMNAILFNVALVNISMDLSISTSQVSWIVVGYSMVVAIGSMVYGKLADYVSIKKLFIIAILLISLGSIIGFSNQTYSIIILARLVQASGGAAFIALSMVTVAKMVELTKRPTALAMISASIALAVGIGPLVGGAITNLIGWPFLFLTMVVSIIGIGLLLKFMPKEEINPSSFHFDFIGAGLLFALIASTLLGVNINKMLFILSIVLLILFKVRMTKSKHPLIDIELFKNTTFIRVITIGFIINVGLMANLFLLPVLLAKRNGLSPFSIGIIVFIASLFSILSSFVTGKTLPTIGNIKMIYISTIVMIIGFFMLALIPNPNVIILSIALILTLMSYSSIQVSLNTLVPQTLNPAKIGVGLGLYNLLNFVGMALGPAASSKIMELTNSYSLNFILIALLISGHFLLLYRLPSVQQKAA
ncbi:MFS transporter [Peribacillus simplex]|uniref:MFS transporter n=2 Tax=Peribacillus simplex TaxID=1478 RepID=UPI002E1AF58D|nr:MFS transporter [Peribacillus simplex]MED3987449.1 MFS transporter [Peribacillus simplex]MED4092871.1 MFS transporter [Peribacillus simplex]